MFFNPYRALLLLLRLPLVFSEHKNILVVKCREKKWMQYLSLFGWVNVTRDRDTKSMESRRVLLAGWLHIISWLFYIFFFCFFWKFCPAWEQKVEYKENTALSLVHFNKNVSIHTRSCFCTKYFFKMFSWLVGWPASSWLGCLVWLLSKATTYSTSVRDLWHL